MLSFFSKTEKPIQVKNKNAVMLEALLGKHVPSAAVAYCLGLWQEHPFSFKITRSRSSCLGNYKYEAGKHTITVNNDLNRYSFLVTFIHEVAHMHVQLGIKTFRKRPQPHGKEWKSAFQNIFLPVLNEEVFPLELLAVLSSHMRNPAASSTRDPVLMKALRAYDERPEEAFHLEEVGRGESFLFKGRVFKKIEERRTRALCLEVRTQRKYTIPLMAEVKKI